jgi:hypothetical protein
VEQVFGFRVESEVGQVTKNTQRKLKSMKNIENRVSKVITAWETLAPTKTFGGMTLEVFKEKTKPTFDLREQIPVLESQTTDAETRLLDADKASKDAMLLVVNAVKGDPENGEDGPLYAAMGYIRKSDRKSGLARKAKKTTPPDDESAAVK